MAQEQLSNRAFLFKKIFLKLNVLVTFDIWSPKHIRENQKPKRGSFCNKSPFYIEKKNAKQLQKRSDFDSDKNAFHDDHFS